MAKIKATGRPSAAKNIVLRPSRLRMFLIYIVLFALALGVGLLVRLAINRGGVTAEWAQENWLMGLLVVLGGSALLALIERSRWTLRTLGGDLLEGPSGAFGERITIPFREIDWTLTRRSLSSWLKVGNAIYGSQRVRIIISQWFFNPAELKELLRAIGYEKQPG